VASIWAGTTGRLDPVPVEDVQRFEAEFLDFLRREHEGILNGIRESGNFDDDTDTALGDAYDSFLQQFETSEGHSIRVGKEPDVEPLADEDVEQEQIVRQKRG